MIRNFHRFLLAGVFVTLYSPLPSHVFGQNRYATSDSMSGYVHWIDLYDASNTRIDPRSENPKPYSPEKTCGRCHDFNTISHGWHFDAVDADAIHGRPGQPWLWSDPRTGTHLPLSYRGWSGTQHPDELGLTRWQVAAKLGGYLPGGGPGSEQSLSFQSEYAKKLASEDRSSITGPLPVDCLMCHRNQGSGYSPFVWTEQIESQNFAYAPTAALGLAEISGSMARLKEFDPTAEGAADKLPKVTYEVDRFRSDGKVFIDLVRKPKNDACYYCHTNVSAESLSGSRWLHDEDVHLRAGLACADCHRNGLDHQTVRGFPGEQHAAGRLIASLSCQGCHMGDSQAANGEELEMLAESGRFGAPRPAHRGLPPLHFEKLSCTACHSGPLPESTVGRQINSIVHRLGAHVKRTGEEYPGIVGPVNLPVDISRHDAELASDSNAASDERVYTPHRMLWPSYWAAVKDGQVTALNPETVYELIRRPLKVRREFTEELADVKLSLSERRELLGEERARVKDEERTEEEQAKVTAAETVARRIQVGEQVSASLAALEESFVETFGEDLQGAQAVYISGGAAFARDGENDIKQLPLSEALAKSVKPYAWPIAHNVRPARQSLGAGGCIDCHSDESYFFSAAVTPVGLLPDQVVEPVAVHRLQEADMVRLQNWSQLFRGRPLFKVASLIALAVTCLVSLIALVNSVAGFRRRIA